jgi:hypothetical protein
LSELDDQLRSVLTPCHLHRLHPDVSTEAVVAVDPVVTLPIRDVGVDSPGVRVRQDVEKSSGICLVLHVAHHLRWTS